MMDKKLLKKLLSLGGVFAVGVASSYIIRAYLDILRIKQIKKELDNQN